LKVLHFLLVLPLMLAAGASMAADLEAGKKAYDYFCYQCHAYAGTGQTLAARYLAPPPRDFTRADPAVLTRERMLISVAEGRDGTAMESFSRVLNGAQREAVVDYIRAEFMSGKPAPGRYHTPANGWADHEAKYGPAYPFANGEIATDTPVEQLDENQRIGLELFRTSCVSCHDKAKVNDEGMIWRARASSYPRRHYDHRVGPWDAETSATPYQRHDIPPDVSGASTLVQMGQKVFLDNCAFCHGADGTGKNWIGSFMEPPAADLTAPRYTAWPSETLRAVILGGVPGGTMPAWRGLLDENQIDSLLAYLNAIVTGSGDHSELPQAAAPAHVPAPGTPSWKRD